MEARDRSVVDAAWRVIVRDGLAGLSVRALAAEAGLPPSSLRTTFPSQAGARSAAVLEALRQQQRRIGRARGSRETLLALLPLDPERRTEAAVLLALRTTALVEPQLRALGDEADETVLAACEDALRDRGGADPVQVHVLHALVIGLSARLLGDPGLEHWAVRALDRFLEQGPVPVPATVVG